MWEGERGIGVRVEGNDTVGAGAGRAGWECKAAFSWFENESFNVIILEQLDYEPHLFRKRIKSNTQRFESI